MWLLSAKIQNFNVVFYFDMELKFTFLSLSAQYKGGNYVYWNKRNEKKSRIWGKNTIAIVGCL